MDGFLLGLELAMNNLAVPECGERGGPYVELISDIFRETMEYGGVKRLWTRYLRELANRRRAVPWSREQMCRDVAALFVRAERSCVRPVWPENAVELIERVLRETVLEERSVRIIRMLYGIGGTKKRTMEEASTREMRKTSLGGG